MGFLTTEDTEDTENTEGGNRRRRERAGALVLTTNGHE